MQTEKNTRVKLKSFLGTLISQKKVNASDDYWKLIGENGKVIDKKEINHGRILILFENDLDKYEVANHNPIKNSLWIKKSDLEFL